MSASESGWADPPPGYQEFLSDLSHELRTPLTVVRGAATILLQSTGEIPMERQIEMLELIDRQAEVMSDRMDDLVALAGLDGGTLRLHLTEVHIEEVLEEVTQWASRRLAGRSLEVSGSGAGVLADRDRLLQVVRCLVDNAIRRTAEKGTIWVATLAGTAQPSIRVQDDGPSVAGAADELFARPPRIGEGNLGPHLARGLARAMGGDVTAEVGDSGGTVFSITLRGID